MKLLKQCLLFRHQHLMSVFNLIELQKKSTVSSQCQIIASIFENNIYRPLSKRDIEKEFGLRCCLQHISFPKQFDSIEDIISQCLPLPGDVQRALRNFYTKYEKYGLECHQEKGKRKIVYIWNPKLMSEFDITVSETMRNIFKTKAKVEEFKNMYNNMCELCASDKRLSIDHWRAYSTYKIDDEKLAVLLCEKCNNIHHNRDAIHCAKNHADDITYLKKWLDIETRIRQNGFMPNEKDALYQRKIQQQISNRWEYHHKAPLPSHFWEIN
jgi:hypothetical protein